MKKRLAVQIIISERWRGGGGHTTQAKITAAANTEPPKPSWNPIATAKAVTVAEWDDGIPPEPISCLKSHLLSLYLKIYQTLRLLGYIKMYAFSYNTGILQ